MKTVLAACAACAAALALVPAAGAAVRPGTYSGRTDEGRKITFRVSKTRARRVSTVSARFTIACANPSDPLNPLLITLKPTPDVLGVRARVRHRRFSFRTSPEDAAEAKDIVVTFKGRFGGRKAAGTLRVRFPGATAGHPDYGDCDTGAITFNVRHR